MSEPQGQSGHVRIKSPPPGLDSRTGQPAVIRYTDYIIPAHSLLQLADTFAALYGTQRLYDLFRNVQHYILQ
jgi:hypothetical protein